jgi:hypothetical protein
LLAPAYGSGNFLFFRPLDLLVLFVPLEAFEWLCAVVDAEVAAEVGAGAGAVVFVEFVSFVKFTSTGVCKC